MHQDDVIHVLFSTTFVLKKCPFHDRGIMSPRDIPYIHICLVNTCTKSPQKIQSKVVLISHIFKNNMYQIIKPAQFFWISRSSVTFGPCDRRLDEVFGGKEKYRQRILLLLRELIDAWSILIMIPWGPRQPEEHVTVIAFWCFGTMGFVSWLSTIYWEFHGISSSQLT